MASRPRRVPYTTPVGPSPVPEPEPEYTVAEEVAEVSDTHCPHCGAQLIDHEVTTGPKAGAWHCNSCGCCFVRDAIGAWVLRPGHPQCLPSVAG